MSDETWQTAIEAELEAVKAKIADAERRLADEKAFGAKMHDSMRRVFGQYNQRILELETRLAQAEHVIAVADRLRAADAEGRWLHDWAAYDAERAKLGATK